ncbi:sensor histidine kinase [Streptomyces sp. ME19-01-6]|uniref:sensor histidine kinase n=1 Tax=Streptomyces sp. ME19-01-6 TaxID=3028686 RepID=UPI0029BEBA03|nr:histidine kinase [Streptomyces sp. ME19-01-6]MDX3228047.1 histidine kinase [Streptomyces sp. ME19-01-6]
MSLLPLGRCLPAAAMVVADTALFVAARHGGPLPWAAVGYALAVAGVVALGERAPAAAFTAALLLAALTGGSYVLLLWAAYGAGHRAVAGRDTAQVAGAALGWIAVRLTIWPTDAPAVQQLISTFVVFVALPLLVGRYLAQHRRLVAELGRRNRRLRRERELLAERERLRIRLRIARDMHDSLGRRLSLVSVQAAALEVTELPPGQREAVRQLAGAARGAMDELHELVGALRGTDETAVRTPGAEAIDEVVAEFRAAGVPVALRRGGQPRPLPPAAGEAVYRVVEEGLTNAARHAPGRPVTVCVTWEPDALLVTVVNPVADGPRNLDETGGGPGRHGRHGLRGLDERMRQIGGFVDHRLSDDVFRLVAMVPTAPDPLAGDSSALDLGPDGDDSDVAVGPGGLRTAALGFATAAVMFVVLPVGMLLGVG